MKKTLQILTIGIIVSNLALFGVSSVSATSVDYVPVLTVKVNGRKVNSSYVVRTRILEGTAKNKKKNFERIVDSCNKGECGYASFSKTDYKKNKPEFYLEKLADKVPKDILESSVDTTKYYKDNKADVEFSYLLEDINLAIRDGKKIDYEISINTKEDKVVIDKINQGEYTEKDVEKAGRPFWRKALPYIVVPSIIFMAVIFFVIGTHRRK
ncbi:MAG: hypothetical protein Q8P90_04855 [bacterium]|nr:hypothetical protein [bacterium]